MAIINIKAKKSLIAQINSQIQLTKMQLNIFDNQDSKLKQTLEQVISLGEDMLKYEKYFTTNEFMTCLWIFYNMAILFNVSATPLAKENALSSIKQKMASLNKKTDLIKGNANPEPSEKLSDNPNENPNQIDKKIIISQANRTAQKINKVVDNFLSIEQMIIFQKRDIKRQLKAKKNISDLKKKIYIEQMLDECERIMLLINKLRIIFQQVSSYADKNYSINNINNLTDLEAIMSEIIRHQLEIYHCISELDYSKRLSMLIDIEENIDKLDEMLNEEIFHTTLSKKIGG